MSETNSVSMHHLFDAELRYQDGTPPVCELDDRGHLVGSGTGFVRGPRIHGTLRWSNFEQVFDDHCRLSVVGTIDTDDGAQIRFDSQCFAVPPTRAGVWRVASAARFAVEDPRYRWLQAVPAIWQGEFDEATATAHYHAYLPSVAGSDDVSEARRRCVPSKTQLRAGELFWQAGHHPFRGIRTQAEAVNLPVHVEENDELVARLPKEKHEDLIAACGWELIQGEAAFTDPETLRVNGRAVRSDADVLATGAGPAVPRIPGLDQVDYLTSTSLLDLKTLPEHLIVIGAGYVGLELGQLFRHVGSRVTLTQRGHRLLRSFEPEIGEVMHEVLLEEGLEVLTGVTYLRAEQHGIANN